MRELVPGARVAIAHGQMDESRLERVVLGLRGARATTCSSARRSSRAASTCRRSTRWSSTAPTCSASRSSTSCAAASAAAGQRAYAYLLHPRDRVLSEEAYERLKAIGEFTDLGSGFKLAMRDLEIRGAGNLLGGAQSGHIAAVGFDLYCELVTEAVGELKGEPQVEPFEVRDRRARSTRTCRATTSAATTSAWRRTAGSPRSPTRPTSTTCGPSGSTGTARSRRRPKRCSPWRGSGPSACGSGRRACRCRRAWRGSRASTLQESQKVRLRRLAPEATAKEDGEVAVPLAVAAEAVPDALLTLLRELIPPAPRRAGAP